MFEGSSQEHYESAKGGSNAIRTISTGVLQKSQMGRIRACEARMNASREPETFHGPRNNAEKCPRYMVSQART